MTQESKELSTNFTAPLDGYYRVGSILFISEPVEGEFRTIENPDRRWWQFWKPRYVQVQKYVTKETWKGESVAYLKAGQTIETTKAYRI